MNTAIEPELPMEERIIKEIIPNGCINLRSYKHEKEAIINCMHLHHFRKCEEAVAKLEAELKDGDESLCAKLRNALSPHYGLPSVISKLRKHPDILNIAEDMSEQAMKNNLRIDTLLNAIDSQLESKNEVERTAIGFFEWMEENGWLITDNKNKLYAQMNNESPFDIPEHGKLIWKEDYEMFKEPHKTLHELYTTYTQGK